MKLTLTHINPIPYMKKVKRVEPRLVVMLVFMFLMAFPHLALAAGDGGEDQLNLGELLDWVVGLLKGPLGKICALVSFAAGMIAGAARGNFTALLIGVAFAVAFYYGPDIILNVFGAVI